MLCGNALCPFRGICWLNWVNGSLPHSPQDKTFLPLGVTEAQFVFLVNSFIAAAGVVLWNCKNMNTTSFTEWIRLMTEAASFEYSFARMNNTKGTSSEDWGNFFLFIKGS